MLTVLNVILFTVPLVSILFATIYIYNSAEFIELLVSQPIKRSKIWISLFISLALSLIISFLIGSGIPLLINAPNLNGIMMLLIGVLITAIFVSLAFLSAIFNRDKARGIGASIVIWLFFALIFDGLILFLLFQFSDYPIEKPMIFVTSLSPIDLARIQMLLHLDASAMMGYTGALFKEYFGNGIGIIISLLLLVLWVIIPFILSLKKFKTKDL
jgi:Cu-processing system permease protein